MAQIKLEREKAAACALVAARRAAVLWPTAPHDCFTGPATIDFEVRLRRFRDPLVNLPASLKAYQDGLCRGLTNHPGGWKLLPDGDGPNTAYVWNPPTQVKVTAKQDEGVLVTIREGAWRSVSSGTRVVTR